MAFKDETLGQGFNKSEINTDLTKKTAILSQPQLNPILTNAPEPLKKAMDDDKNTFKIINALTVGGAKGASLAVCDILKLSITQREKFERELINFFQSHEKKLVSIYRDSFKIAIKDSYDSSKTDQERIDTLAAAKELGPSYKVTPEETLQTIAKGKSKPELDKLSNLASKAGYSSSAIKIIGFRQSEFKPNNPITPDVITHLAVQQQKLLALANATSELLEKLKKQTGESKEQEDQNA